MLADEHLSGDDVQIAKGVAISDDPADDSAKLAREAEQPIDAHLKASGGLDALEIFWWKGRSVAIPTPPIVWVHPKIASDKG